MTSREFRIRLERRLRAASVPTPPADVLERLETYYRLLAKWNAKLNLTALNLEAPGDETFDRLLVEPLSAARQVAEEPLTWIDLGSGGGSPAIPLKLVRTRSQLTMVESKARKAAFLSEAIRVLELPRTFVANRRFDELDGELKGHCDLVSVRAVRLDTSVFTFGRNALRDGGAMLLFRSSQKSETVPGFQLVSTNRLSAADSSYLLTYRRVFHVEHN